MAEQSSSVRGGPASSSTVPKSFVVHAIAQFLHENAIPLEELDRAIEVQRAQERSERPPRLPTEVLALSDHVRAGRWDVVVELLAQHPFLLDGQQQRRGLAMDLFEHMARVLVQGGALESARVLIQRATPLGVVMKREDPARYAVLTKLAEGDRGLKAFDAVAEQEERERLALAARLEKIVNGEPEKQAEMGAAEIPPLEPSTLLNLIQESAKWRKLTGSKRIGDWLERDKEEGGSIHDQIKRQSLSQSQRTGLHVTFAKPGSVSSRVAKGVSIISTCTSNDGTTFAIGTSDGFIELLRSDNLKQRGDLPYQANDEPLFIDSPVLCLAFSLDSELIACGDASGKVSVFRVANGSRLIRLDTGHIRGGITSLCISPDGTKIATGGAEGTCRIFSLATGSKLCECAGHESFVNTISYISQNRIVTGSSDERVCIWSANTGEQIRVINGLGGKITRIIPFCRQYNSSRDDGPTASVRYGEIDQIAVCSEGSVSTISLDSYAVNTIVPPCGKGGIVDCSIMRNGSVLVYGTQEGKIGMYDFIEQKSTIVVNNKITLGDKKKNEPTTLVSIHFSPIDDQSLFIAWVNIVAKFSV